MKWLVPDRSRIRHEVRLIGLLFLILAGFLMAKGLSKFAEELKVPPRRAAGSTAGCTDACYWMKFRETIWKSVLEVVHFDVPSGGNSHPATLQLS